MKLIYKLNDATFRPVFAQLMEWSATGPSQQDKTGRVLRQQSLFAFLAAFFSSLKSIVTSYATYVVDVAAAILRETDLRDVDDRELWRRVLRTLARCFEHDQDGFWQAPAHFQAVAPLLIDQFEAALTTASDEAGGQQAAARDVAGELVPAVVELAAAADSKEHHKELNGALLKLLRSRDAAVRLAVVRCQQSLTQRLGEEWLHALPEMLPFISELQDDDDEAVERENRRWIVGIEGILGESLDSMLQ